MLKVTGSDLDIDGYGLDLCANGQQFKISKMVSIKFAHHHQL